RAIRELYRSTDLRAKLAKYHDYPDETFFGWNDIWLDPAFRDWNIETALAAIRCPLLIIQGENDEYGTLAQVEAIKDRLPHAETLILPRCGHWPHRDHCAATLFGISNFVAKL